MFIKFVFCFINQFQNQSKSNEQQEKFQGRYAPFKIDKLNSYILCLLHFKSGLKKKNIKISLEEVFQSSVEKLKTSQGNDLVVRKGIKKVAEKEVKTLSTF